jgi:hypothetical protein
MTGTSKMQHWRENIYKWLTIESIKAMADWDHMTSRGDVIGWLQPGSNHGWIGFDDTVPSVNSITLVTSPAGHGISIQQWQGWQYDTIKTSLTQHRDPSSKAPPAGSYPYQLKSCSEYIWAVQYCIQTDCLIKQNAQTAVAFFAKSRLG